MHLSLPLLQVLVCLACVAPAMAAPPPLSLPVIQDDAAPHGALDFLGGLHRSNTLLGDMWGMRTNLSRYGMSLGIQETSEYLGNTSGGTHKGFEYDGLTQIVLQMDTRRAFGHDGGLFNVSALNIHGRNLSTDHLQSLQTASGIAADRATRLWELWYDQKFLEEDRLDVKVGQQSVDQEFMVSSNALYFINTMFGWPMVPSADMPAGGPAYPLSALGVRLSMRPFNGVTVLAGLYNGSPVRHDDGSDAQRQNRHGTSFPLGEGILALVELQFAYPAQGSMVRPGDAQTLGWTGRLGAWFNSSNVADQRVDRTGLSLADPASTGQARTHRGNYAFYGVADQLVWRDGRDPNRTAAVFVRLMGTPLKNRNLIDLSANAGLVMRSPFRYRTADTFGIGVGYARVGSQAGALDRDAITFSGFATPVRSSEKFVELTYQYQIKPWILMQPDVQYVIHPGAGISRLDDPSQRLRNELVLGVRTTISF